MSNLVRALAATGNKYLRASVKPSSYLSILERILMLKRHGCSAPQLFILGLPRSGTTLIYQYIASRLKVAYFTNGVGRYPGAPCIVTFAEHRKYGQYVSDFRSHYGKVEGHVAPREGGGFWNRFFDIDNYVEINDLTERDIYFLRNTVALISKIFGGLPFVNKNVKHLLRINALSQIFPDSVFLVVERDLTDVALSILRGRYEILPDPTQWWSVRPPNYHALKNLPILAQVGHQCVLVKRKMEKDLSDLAEDRIIRVGYEDFCKTPESLIHNLQSCLGAKETSNPPQAHFDFKRSDAQNQEEIALVNLIGSLIHE